MNVYTDFEFFLSPVLTGWFCFDQKVSLSLWLISELLSQSFFPVVAAVLSTYAQAESVTGLGRRQVSSTTTTRGER